MVAPYWRCAALKTGMLMRNLQAFANALIMNENMGTTSFIQKMVERKNKGLIE